MKPLRKDSPLTNQKNKAMTKRTTLWAALAAATLQSGCTDTEGFVAGEHRRLNINGVSLSYVEKGTGEPIVAVHGASSDLRVWNALAESLPDDWRFIAYTQRYFGADPWPDDGENFSRKTHIADLIKFIEALDLGPVHLVTWSYGGDVATYAAAERPDLFRTIVHYDPSVDAMTPNTEHGAASQRAYIEALNPAIIMLRAGDIEEAAFRFVDIIAGLPAGQSEQEDAPLPAMVRDNARTLAPMLAMTSDETLSCTDLEELTVPTLIILGERTHGRYRLIAERMVACLNDGALQILPDAHHDGPYRHAGAFAKLIDAFLRRNRRIDETLQQETRP